MSHQNSKQKSQIPLSRVDKNIRIDNSGKSSASKLDERKKVSLKTFHDSCEVRTTEAFGETISYMQVGSDVYFSIEILAIIGISKHEGRHFSCASESADS